jgi:carboxyl-terminal processing protease
MVVLVNELTGNAAEALAGALQDAERAEIMGTRTAGEGSAHDFKLLSDGSAIYLSVSHWYTPSSRQIQGAGIEPDISVELTDEDRLRGVDSQLGEAYRHLNAQLPFFR